MLLFIYWSCVPDPLGELIDGCITGFTGWFITGTLGAGENGGCITGRFFDEFLGKTFIIKIIIRTKSNMAKTDNRK